MTKHTDRTVYRNSAGKWVNKKDENSRATSVHDTQKAAVDKAKKQIGNDGGGELKIKGESGRIRSKDTVPPGNDPNPPKDKEH